MPLPLLLCGPILRRVEPTLVTVWAALSRECTVQVSLWDTLVADHGATRLFTSSLTKVESIEDSARTVRIGDQLHLAAVTFKLAPEKPLLPHQIYSYNVAFQELNQDLKSLGLLRNDKVEGHPHLCLGYEPNFLPSFALPPFELTNLRIAHGSCRRINQSMEDGLSWVDDLIREKRADPKTRLHQMLHSGDQIYADDVPLPFLPMLTKRGMELLGDNEFLPTLWPKEIAPTYWPADAKHFPSGMRDEFIRSEARMTTVDCCSHLMSVGEFAAMYLAVWSNAIWDLNEIKDFDEIIDGVNDLPPTWGAMLKVKKERPDEDEIEIDESSLERFARFLFKDVPKAELREALKSEDPTGPEPDKEPISNDRLRRDKPDGMKDADWEDYKLRFKTIYNFAINLPSAELEKFKVVLDRFKSMFGERYKTAKSTRIEQIMATYNSLPKVRRALANVPNYMMWDDHEITDDWNLNPIWKSRVFTSHLGRAILRNGILAYALFQGWGNDPEKFKKEGHKEMLERASKLFPAGLTRPPTTEPEDAARLNILFGLGDDDKEQLKWHYSVKCARHLLLAIDNRTRRSFVSPIGPPGNVSETALKDQVPDGPLEAGVEVVIVIAPLPVLGPPVLDELVAPLAYRIFDIKSYSVVKEKLGSMPGTNPDAIEAWAFDPVTMEKLLKRLEPYRRVVLLSGDVHFGSSQFMSYWKKEDQEPARFVQFTSSGLKNVMPWYIRLADRSFPLAQRIVRQNLGNERLGWFNKSPEPVKVLSNVKPVAALQRRLGQSPVLLPTKGWPDRTILNLPPDWTWRIHVLRDERPDAKRPEPVKPDSLAADLGSDPIESYRQIAIRHNGQLRKMNHGRQILFSNNLGLIFFDIRQEAGGKFLHVTQQLLTTFRDAADPTKPEVYTEHDAVLAALDGAKLNEPKPKI